MTAESRPPSPSVTLPTICPNSTKHAKEAARWMEMEPWYKTERRGWMYREGYQSAQRACDWCNPPCPTCSHRARRDHAPWLLPQSAQGGGTGE